jgi:hypothetical protein
MLQNIARSMSEDFGAYEEKLTREDVMKHLEKKAEESKARIQFCNEQYQVLVDQINYWSNAAKTTKYPVVTTVEISRWEDDLQSWAKAKLAAPREFDACMRRLKEFETKKIRPQLYYQYMI